MLFSLLTENGTNLEEKINNNKNEIKYEGILHHFYSPLQPYPPPL